MRSRILEELFFPPNIVEIDPADVTNRAARDPSIATEQKLGPDGMIMEQPVVLSRTERRYVGLHFHFLSARRG